MTQISDVKRRLSHEYAKMADSAKMCGARDADQFAECLLVHDGHDYGGILFHIITFGFGRSRCARCGCQNLSPFI